ncbi:MAG: hypothetical protein ACYTBP_15900, partial [Planctomycetota bacterium]
MSNSTIESNIEKAGRIYHALRENRPKTKTQLKNYIKIFLGINIPGNKICPDHHAPIDYLWHSFNSDFADKKMTNADTIVWANRGGGKTEIAAVATLLDCVFKPNCQVRILSGSGEQAGRMYEYLTSFLPRGFEQYLAEPVRKQKCTFT